MTLINTVEYWKEILYIVSLKEGAYESIQPSSRLEGMTQMTIKNVLLEQKRRQNGNNITAAAGRYQFLSSYKDDPKGKKFENTARMAGLDWNTDLFSPINQDKMAVATIETVRKIDRSLIETDPIEAGKRLAMEWASLPILADIPDKGKKRGESYYQGNLNRAGVTPEQVEGAFARFLGRQPKMDNYRGLAAAGEQPALTMAGLGDGGPPTYGNASLAPAAAYNPVVTQRETPLVSMDQLLDLLRPENRIQNIPASTPRITSQQYQDNRVIDYRANMYSSPTYKQTTMPPRDTFYGIVTDVVSVNKEDLTLRSGQDIMVSYAIINDQPEIPPEKIVYVYPIIDQEGNTMDYLPDEQDPKSLIIDRSIKYEALYDRLSIGTDIVSTIEKDKIVKIRKKGPNLDILRIIGVIGSPTTIFANLIGGSGGGASGAAYGSAIGGPGSFPPWDQSKSPPARIVGPVGADVWKGEDAIFTNTQKTSINDICDMSSIPYLATNIVYAGPNNFTNSTMKGYVAEKAWCYCNYIKGFYKTAKAAYDGGYGIIVYDAYRPFDAQRHMADWADSIGKPCLYKGRSYAGGCGVMIGSPTGNGSNHNRGAAWDVAMYKITSDQKIGTIINSEDFGGPFDNILEPKTAAFYWSGASTEQKENRNRLKRFMGAGGFANISNEWWHYERDGGGIQRPISGEAGWIK